MASTCRRSGVIVQSTVHGSVQDVEETNLLYLENMKDLRFYTNESILLLCFVLLSAVCVHVFPCISSVTSLVRLTPIIVEVAGRSLR